MLPATIPAITIAGNRQPLSSSSDSSDPLCLFEPKRHRIVVDINCSSTYKAKHERNVIPTLLKSSVLVLLCKDATEDCLFTPSEMTAIHGLDIPEPVLRRLTLRQAHTLVGNSMHVAQIGTFVQCMLATRTWSGDQ